METLAVPGIAIVFSVIALVINTNVARSKADIAYIAKLEARVDNLEKRIIEQEIVREELLALNFALKKDILRIGAGQ